MNLLFDGLRFENCIFPNDRMFSYNSNKIEDDGISAMGGFATGFLSDGSEIQAYLPPKQFKMINSTYSNNVVLK